MKHSSTFAATLCLVLLATAQGCRCSSQPVAAYRPQPGSADLLDVSVPDDIPSQILQYEGHTLSFNPQTRQPNWVAWELTGAECRAMNASRDEAMFMPDPNVVRSASLADYRGSGYDRGHMAPAADMKWSRKAMDECFYLSNICPQKKQLNNGSWNNLEIKCREWAQRDSAIVIVCGPIFSDPVEYIGEGQVAVPGSFFKVVLAPYADPPRGIGFIMPNGNVPGGMQPAAVSIRQVEDATGFDFFSALPDDIEDEAETQCNFPKWNRK